MISTSDVD